MPKRSELAVGIERLVQQQGEDRVHEMFGINPELLEKPEEHDPVAAREQAQNEALCSAIKSLEDAVQGASESQVKAIGASVVKIPSGLATDKGIEKSIKALSKTIETSLKRRPESGVPALLARMVELIEENQRLSAALVAAANKESKSDKTPVRYDINRDRNQFIESVTAVPL